LGIDANGKVYSSILEILSKKGWRTGLAATSTITHATPAGFASHVSSRAKEEQIARQMLNCRVDILFGGGKKYWLPAAIGGARSDGANLLNQAKSAGWQIIDTKQQLDALLPGPAIGLFADDALTTYSPEPAIAEMTAAAIKLLSAESKDWFAPEPKFFLMVEGSQIDWACHKNNADNCVRQTLLFDLAVKEALDFAGRDKQTLVIVTADHETGGLVLTADKNGKEIAARWTTKGHTAADVPLFAFGPGCEKFSGCIDNTDIPKKIADLLNLADFPKVLEQKNAEERSPLPAACAD
jgi:alkaline phosphatase